MPLNQHILANKALTTIDVVVSEKDGGLTPRSAIGAPMHIRQTLPLSLTVTEPSTRASVPTGASSDTPPRISSTPSFTDTTAVRKPSAVPFPVQSPPSASLSQTALGTGSSGLTNPNSNPNPPTSSTAAKKANRGATAIGVAAGVIALFLLVALLFRRGRRKNRYAADAVLGCSSSPQIGGYRNGTARGIVPDPFPAIYQFNASRVTTSSTYEVGGNPAALSEKARIYLEQQMLVSDAWSSDWPQPMNAKHSGVHGATQAPTTTGASSRPSGSSDMLASPSSRQTTVPRSTAAIPPPLPASIPTTPPVISNTPRMMGTVQDEDSGIRLMQHSDTGGFVEVLPPSYSAH